VPYSTTGLFAAACALALGLTGYLLVIPPVQAWLRSVAPRDTQAQRDDLEFKLGVMRRLILSIGFAGLAWAGYSLGKTIAG
jgi:hypothetical protein